MNAPVPSLPTPPVAEAVPEPLNPFFRITIFAGGLFVITILAMICLLYTSDAADDSLV